MTGTIPAVPVIPSEKSLEQRSVRLIERRGGWVVKGDANSKKGTPDRLACYRGWFMALEFKKVGGAPPTKIQQRRLQEIKDAGGFAEVITSVGSVEAILDTIDALPFLTGGSGRR